MKCLLPRQLSGLSLENSGLLGNALRCYEPKAGAGEGSKASTGVIEDRREDDRQRDGVDDERAEGKQDANQSF